MSDTPKRPRPSRTRAEVQQAYSALSAPATLSQKEKDEKAQLAESLRSSIADVTAEKAAQALASAGVAMQKSLSEASQELSTRIAQLSSVKENIALEIEELERVYGAGTVLRHLDVLVAEHDEKKAALETEIAALRAVWAEETAKQNKDRLRENEDFNYKTNQERKLNLDQWNESLRVRQIAERDRIEAQDKNWRIREEALQLRETELVDLKAAVAKHQEEINKAVGQAVGAKEASLKKDYEHTLALAQKDQHATSMVADGKVQSLQAALDRANQLNVDLQAALAEANRKNVELANKALDSSSNKSALDAVQNLIKDQQGGNGSARKS